MNINNKYVKNLGNLIDISNNFSTNNIKKSRLEKDLQKMPIINDHLTIRDSKYEQEYGSLRSKECQFCGDNKHNISIYSNKDTNALLDKYQKAILIISTKNNDKVKKDFEKQKNVNHEFILPRKKEFYKFFKEEGMAGACIVKKSGKIVAKYITHSGATNTKMKEVYQEMRVEDIFDYQNKEKSNKVNIKADKLYAIHADYAVDINGKYLNIYGAEIKKIGPYTLLTKKEGEKAKDPQNSIFLKYRVFGCCAAQKILQQVAKDFGSEIKENPNLFEISMSEAWFKTSGEKIYSSDKRNKVWSQLNPVPSCDVCTFVLPKLLCERN